MEVFDEIEANITTNTDKKPLKSLRASAPFMAVVVADQMSGEHQFGNSAVLLAKRILRNASDLRMATSGLTHSSIGSTRATEIVIKGLLSPA